MTVSELIERWQYGWGLAKALPPAETVTDAAGKALGLKVRLELPGRFFEFVPFDPADADGFAELAATAERPSQVSLIGLAPEAAEQVFARAGLRMVGTADSLMSIPLADHPVHDPGEEYRVRVTVVEPGAFTDVVGMATRNRDAVPGLVELPQWSRRPPGADAVIQVSLTDSRGRAAAGGLMGLHGTDAIAHAIKTEPEFRRRGLGSVVMSLLSRRALELGAKTGLLVAVPQGRALYLRLGWSNDADFVTGAPPAAD